MRMESSYGVPQLYTLSQLEFNIWYVGMVIDGNYRVIHPFSLW